MLARLRRFTRFPYTTLFRSPVVGDRRRAARAEVEVDVPVGDPRQRRLTDDGVRAFVQRSDGRVLDRQRQLGLARSEEHTSELQSLRHLVCRLLLEKKKTQNS